MKTKTDPKVGHKGPPNVDDLKNRGAGDDGDSGKIQSKLDEQQEKLDELAAALKSAPSMAEVKHLTDEIVAIKQGLQDAKGNYKGLIDALQTRLDELQTGAALSVPKADQPVGLRQVAQMIFESDAYKSLFDANGQKGERYEGRYSDRIVIPSLSAAKAASPVVISDVSGGVQTDVYRPGFAVDPGLPATIRSRIPTAIVSNATKYVVPKETEASRFGAVHSLLTSAIDGDPTPTNTCVVADIEGYMVGAVVRVYAASGGALLGSGTIASLDTGTKTITVGSGEFDFDAAIGDRVVSDNFGATAELGTKPSGHVGTGGDEFTFNTLAELIPTTVNALNTIAGLRMFIENKLPLRYDRNLSKHLIDGAGDAAQLQGFRAKSGAQSYLWSGGETGDNRVDAIIRACSLLPWTSQIGVVMHQHDWPLLGLTKGTDGHYLAQSGFGVWPLTNVGMTWWLGPWELIFDFAATQGEFTAVNWLESSEFVDSDVAELAWGYINDDWAKNIIRARYENTVCHAIFGLWGYMVGTFDGAPS